MPLDTVCKLWPKHQVRMETRETCTILRKTNAQSKMRLWQRRAEVGEHPRITDKQVANPRLHASGCPTYLHTPWKRAMSIRCHAEYYTGFPSPCPANQIKIILSTHTPANNYKCRHNMRNLLLHPLLDQRPLERK